MSALPNKVVKIRKNHLCWGCGVVLKKGESINSNVCVDMGRLFTVYWCDICVGLIESGEDYYQFELKDQAELMREEK